MRITIRFKGGVFAPIYLNSIDNEIDLDFVIGYIQNMLDSEGTFAVTKKTFDKNLIIPYEMLKDSIIEIEE